MLTVLLYVLAIAALPGALVGLALRREYLVVLHWSRIGTMLLERDDDGRYHQIVGWQVPLALLRFLVLSLSLALGALRRTAARARVHLPSPVGGKV